MKLKALQEALFHAIAGEASPRRVSREIQGGALGAEARIHVYGEMYFLRMRDALADDFSRTRAVMGDAAFDATVRRYMKRAPSSHHSLAQFGRTFPAFLARQRRLPRADLAALAQLEWARAKSFVAADAETVSPTAVAALGAEVFANASLQLHPSTRLLKLSHDVLPLFRAVAAETARPKVRRGPRFAIVWRKGFEVFHVGVERDEFTALTRAQAGASVARICQPFASRREGPQQAFRAIASWLNEGMVSQLVPAAARKRRLAPHRAR